MISHIKYTAVQRQFANMARQKAGKPRCVVPRYQARSINYENRCPVPYYARRAKGLFDPIR
jgi:hypothetical protein